MRPHGMAEEPTIHLRMLALPEDEACQEPDIEFQTTAIRLAGTRIRSPPPVGDGIPSEIGMFRQPTSRNGSCYQSVAQRKSADLLKLHIRTTEGVSVGSTICRAGCG